MILFANKRLLIEAFPKYTTLGIANNLTLSSNRIDNTNNTKTFISDCIIIGFLFLTIKIMVNTVELNDDDNPDMLIKIIE